MYLKKALKGTIIAFIFTILAGVSWYLFRFMLARNLSLYEYGLFFAIYALFLFLNLFVDFGFLQAVPKFIINFRVSEDKNELRKVLLMSFGFQIFVSLFLFLLVFLFSDFLSAKYFHSDVSEYLLILGIWFITSPFVYFFSNIYSGFQKYGWVSSIEFSRSFFTLILTFTFFKLGFALYSPILAYVAINFLLALIYIPFSFKLVNFSGFKSKFDSLLFSSLIKFGIFVSFSSILWVVLSQIDTLMVTLFSGIEAVGLYQAAVPLASVALYFITAVNIVSYPLSAELYAKNKFAELSTGINLFYKYILLLLIPFLMILFSFSDSILYVLFGENFVRAGLALKILLIGAIFSSITLFNNNMISAIGKPKIVAKTMIYVALLNVVLCIILIPLLNINGAALATAFSFFVGSILSVRALANNIKIKIPAFEWLKTVFAGFLMVGFIYLFKQLLNIETILGFAVLGSFALLFYFLLCFLLKMVDVEEIKFFIKNIR